ncbi:unnamed protein product [Tilletia laevis]|nr:unnamed protein product [Tilletia laevis]
MRSGPRAALAPSPSPIAPEALTGAHQRGLRLRAAPTLPSTTSLLQQHSQSSVVSNGAVPSQLAPQSTSTRQPARATRQAIRQPSRAGPSDHSPNGSTLSLSRVVPARSLTTAEACRSLSSDNIPTCTMTADAALDIDARAEVALVLTPALYLLEAVHGSSDVAAARAASELIWNSVTKDTQEKYAGHIITFLTWCDDLGLPIHYRFPIAANILFMYLQKDMTTLRPSTLEQRSYALAYWHRTQRMPWALDRPETRALKKAAKIQC